MGETDATRCFFSDVPTGRVVRWPRRAELAGLACDSYYNAAMGDVETAREEDIDAVTALLGRCAAHMAEQGNDQWAHGYPTRDNVAADFAAGTLFVRREGATIVAAVTVDHNQPAVYATPKFTPAAKVLVIHRLAVEPAMQGRGIAREMMAWIEALARRRGCDAIRFDTYSRNARAVRFYEALGYQRVEGTVRFPLRDDVFYCFEKMM